MNNPNQPNIKIYQTYYCNSQIKQLDKACTPLNVKDNPNHDHREIEYLHDIYQKSEHKQHKLTGLFSWKFHQKMGVPVDNVIHQINTLPNQDLYIFSPFPEESAKHYNVWEQGEKHHPGISKVADSLFESANLPYRTSTTKRNTNETLSFSNYWVGNENFWEHYGETISKMLGTIKKEAMADIYKNTSYEGEFNTPLFPFIFERLISTILTHSHQFSHAYYDHSSSQLKLGQGKC